MTEHQLLNRVISSSKLKIAAIVIPSFQSVLRFAVSILKNTDTSPTGEVIRKKRAFSCYSDPGMAFAVKVSCRDWSEYVSFPP